MSLLSPQELEKIVFEAPNWTADAIARAQLKKDIAEVKDILANTGMWRLRNVILDWLEAARKEVE